MGVLGCVIIGGLQPSFADVECYITIERIGTDNPFQMCFPHRAHKAENRSECLESADKDLKSIGFKRSGICHSKEDCWTHEKDCYRGKTDKTPCKPCDAK